MREKEKMFSTWKERQASDIHIYLHGKVMMAFQEIIVKSIDAPQHNRW